MVLNVGHKTVTIDNVTNQRIECVEGLFTKSCTKTLLPDIKPTPTILAPIVEEQKENFNTFDLLFSQSALTYFTITFLVISFICGIIFWLRKSKKYSFCKSKDIAFTAMVETNDFCPSISCPNSFICETQFFTTESVLPSKMEIDDEGVATDSVDDNMKLINENTVEAETEDELSQYLIPAGNLEFFNNNLGQGHFSIVRGANYIFNSKTIKVAVKTLNSKCSKTDTLKEIKLSSICKHLNIVSFIGWTKTPDGEMCIVNEYMAGGDLYNYLKNPEIIFTVSTVFSYIFQVLDAMIYLHGKGIIHRDLAARNCLLNETYDLLKITDFGLSREVDSYGSYIVATKTRPLPRLWLPLEAHTGSETFTFKGDVWSFAILIWEIFERGNKLYDGVAYEVFIDYLQSGNRLKCPQHCPEQLYYVMLSCWDEKPEKRPDFDDLDKKIHKIYDELKGKEPEYLN